MHTLQIALRYGSKTYFDRNYFKCMFYYFKMSSGNVQTVVSGNSYNFIKKESIISLKGNVHITLGAFTYMV